MLIDVEGLIASKHPRLLKWMPPPLIRYLKRIVHQREINEVLIENKGVDSYGFSQYVINRFRIRTTVEGIEHVPKEGGVILAMNHPLGGMDAMAIITAFQPYRPDFKFIVNDLLLHLDNLKDRFVGVNKHGANSKEALETIDQLFASEQAVFVFPAGLVSRKKRGVVTDLSWKKTFITRAKKHRRSIVPVHIDGELSPFFYRLSNFRAAIGIRTNIEMLYLADELFKQQDASIRLTFGSPIPPTTFDHRKRDVEWAQWVKQRVYELKK